MSALPPGFLARSLGRIKPSPTLAMTQKSRELKAAASDYDYVLVDLPPILPVVDVKAVAHLFDGFVLVVEWGSTSTEEVVKAVGSGRSEAEAIGISRSEQDRMASAFRVADSV